MSTKIFARQMMIMFAIVVAQYLELRAQNLLAVCDMVKDKPTYEGTQIPATKCLTKPIDKGLLMACHPMSLVPQSDILGGNLFVIQGISFAEVYFRNADCGTIAIMFAEVAGRKIIHTRSYSVDLNEQDMRYENTTDSHQSRAIIIYRKVPSSFEGFRTLTVYFWYIDNSISLGLDDGLSRW